MGFVSRSVSHASTALQRQPMRDGVNWIGFGNRPSRAIRHTVERSSGIRARSSSAVMIRSLKSSGWFTGVVLRFAMSQDSTIGQCV